MFPIPSGRELSFIEIANYWSREIRASPQELRMEMSKAWWRGELTAAKGPSRPKLLQAVRLHCADNIAVAVPGVTDPPSSRLLDDGSVEVFRLVRLPLPNADPDTWTDANCAEAFAAIAEACYLIREPFCRVGAARQPLLQAIGQADHHPGIRVRYTPHLFF